MGPYFSTHIVPVPMHGYDLWWPMCFKQAQGHWNWPRNEEDMAKTMIELVLLQLKLVNFEKNAIKNWNKSVKSQK